MIPILAKLERYDSSLKLWEGSTREVLVVNVTDLLCIVLVDGTLEVYEHPDIRLTDCRERDASLVALLPELGKKLRELLSPLDGTARVELGRPEGSAPPEPDPGSGLMVYIPLLDPPVTAQNVREGEEGAAVCVTWKGRRFRVNRWGAEDMSDPGFLWANAAAAELDKALKLAREKVESAPPPPKDTAVLWVDDSADRDSRGILEHLTKAGYHVEERESGELGAHYLVVPGDERFAARQALEAYLEVKPQLDALDRRAGGVS